MIFTKISMNNLVWKYWLVVVSWIFCFLSPFLYLFAPKIQSSSSLMREVVLWSKFLTLEPFFLIYTESFILLYLWISEAKHHKWGKDVKALNKQNCEILIMRMEVILIRENLKLTKLHLEYILDIA